MHFYSFVDAYIIHSGCTDKNKLFNLKTVDGDKTSSDNIQMGHNDLQQ